MARVKENGQKLMNSQFKLGQRGRAKDRFRGGEETRDGEGRPQGKNQKENPLI